MCKSFSPRIRNVGCLDYHNLKLKVKNGDIESIAEITGALRTMIVYNESANKKQHLVIVTSGVYRCVWSEFHDLWDVAKIIDSPSFTTDAT